MRITRRTPAYVAPPQVYSITDLTFEQYSDIRFALSVASEDLVVEHETRNRMSKLWTALWDKVEEV